MKEVKGQTKQKSGWKLKWDVERQLKSQGVLEQQQKVTRVEWKTKTWMSTTEIPTEIREQKKNYREIKGPQTKREISKENL